MISDYLTDKVDALTTKLQRHGYRLTDMHVYACFAALSASVTACLARESLAFAAFNGALWGWNLWERLRWAEKNKDYCESLKAMDRLNMEALYWRVSTRWFSSLVIYFGIFFISLMVGGLIADPHLWHLFTIFEWIAIALSFVVRGCFFIGPGEFAKQERESELHNAVLDKSP